MLTRKTLKPKFKKGDHVIYTGPDGAGPDGMSFKTNTVYIVRDCYFYMPKPPLNILPLREIEVEEVIVVEGFGFGLSSVDFRKTKRVK